MQILRIVTRALLHTLCNSKVINLLENFELLQGLIEGIQVIYFQQISMKENAGDGKFRGSMESANSRL